MSPNQFSKKKFGTTIAIVILSAGCNAPEENQFLSHGINTICVNGAIGLVASGRSHVQVSGNGKVRGDALLMDSSSMSMDGNASIQGKAYLADLSLLSMNGGAVLDGSEVRDLSSAQSLLLSFANDLSSLSATQEFSDLSGSQVIQGNGGTNVIAVRGDLRLSGRESLVLHGASSDIFVINVYGRVSLTGQASVKVDGVRAQNVVINNVGGGPGMNLAGQGSIAGTYMGTGRSAQVTGGGVLTGAIVAGQGIQISGNGITVNPDPFCMNTEPASDPSPSPSVDPSPSPSVDPSASPSPDPSASPSPSVDPSASPSPDPSASPSPSPTSDPCNGDLICGGGIIGV